MHEEPKKRDVKTTWPESWPSVEVRGVDLVTGSPVTETIKMAPMSALLEAQFGIKSTKKE